MVPCSNRQDAEQESMKANGIDPVGVQQNNRVTECAI